MFLGESREFRVPILGDNKVELDETFLVELLGFDKPRAERQRGQADGHRHDPATMIRPT